jgi:hypothetical protein
MVFREAKLGSNNSKVGKLSSRFCTCIPIIQLHSIFNLQQIDFSMFVGLHIFFYITTKLIVVSMSKVGKLVAIFLMKVLFITMHVFLSCLVIPWCH